ncbi:MAG: zinc ribbon domain-containing protein [Planctomycetota bacterium]
MSARGALCAALAAVALAGCTVRTQGRPLPEGPPRREVRPVANRAELYYRYEGEPWEGPAAWDKLARRELESSGLLAPDAPPRTVRLELSRVHETPVWRYLVHWLTLFCAPRVSELTLEADAQLLDEQGTVLASGHASSSVESSASLLWLFWPPAYDEPWAAPLHEHPLVLENLERLSAAALAALAGAAPAEPGPAPPQSSACAACGTALEPTWKHCPECGAPAPGGEPSAE